MRSRWLLNLLLLLGVGILVLIARYEPGIRHTPPDATLTPIHTNEVTRIQLSRKDQPPLLLELDDGTWRIAQSPPLPAEESQVASLARLADQTAQRSYPVADMDLKKLELDPPDSSVTLNDLTLDFGALDALDGLRYARVGPRVFMIPDLYQYLIDADASQFVRRRILDPDTHIHRIELPDLTLESVEGRWQATPDPGSAVDSDQLARFVERWENAQALSTRRDATNDNAGTVKLLLRGQDQPVTLVIRARDPELVLARPEWGVQYVMGEAADRFLKLAAPAATPAESAPPTPPPAP